ncbi:MAG: hypothetical protein AAF203_01505 [Pseudomonadota bacterium]
MSSLKRLGLLSLCLFAFQNCGSLNSAPQESATLFSENPVFFADMQLVSVETDDLRRELYTFDVALSLASNHEAPVEYLINFSTLIIVGVCSSVAGTAQGNTKHFRVQCLLPTPDDLYVQLNLSGPDNQTLTQQFQF